jgi:hypothetical protein
MTAPLGHLCQPTEFLDYESPVIAHFIEACVGERHSSQREQAVSLYYAVRDGIEYEVYGADLSRLGMRASEVVKHARGMCIHKSVLYAACLRALEIPSRLVLVDVRNHLSSPRLRSLLGGDVLRYHCLTCLNIEGKWVKAAPVFSARLCRLYRMTPLEFDGRADAVLQPYDEQGNSFIESVHEHGEFDELPYEKVIAGLRSAHVGIFEGPSLRVRGGSLAAEAGGA